MKRSIHRFVVVSVISLTTFVAVSASQSAPPNQATTPPPTTPRTNTPAPVQAPPIQPWHNIKLDITISDSINAQTQNKKTVSMLIADGQKGQVRSTGVFDGLINIDARTRIRDGRIVLDLTVEYRPELTTQQVQQAGEQRVAMFTESLSLVVPDGKLTIASQASDPRSDRKVTVEVTATIMK